MGNQNEDPTENGFRKTCVLLFMLSRQKSADTDLASHRQIVSFHGKVQPVHCTMPTGS